MEVQYSAQGVPRKRRSHCRKIGNSNSQKSQIVEICKSSRHEEPSSDAPAPVYDEIGPNDDAHAYDDNVYVDYLGLERLGLGCIPAQEVVMLTRTLRLDAFLRKTRDYLEVCIAHLERAF